jgi:hypothetical protein
MRPPRTSGRSYRVQLIAMTAVGLGLCACDDRWTKLDPPKVVQLACKPTTGDQSMVFVIDTGLKRAIWANEADGPQGKADVTDREYRLHFPGSAKAYESLAVINRYDGAMQREFGSPPFLQSTGSVKPGNIRQTWRCSMEKTGPKL